MSSILRLQKALRRQGIEVTRADGVFTLTNTEAQASVLLPQDFPLEEKAVRQLMDFASVRVPGHDGHVCKACATPDFHPGSIAPVGSVVATSEDLVIPAIPGTDIACGASLMTTGISLVEFSKKRDLVIAKLKRVLLEDGRDVPLRSKAYAALFDDGPAAFIENIHNQGLWQRVDKNRLLSELDRCIGLNEFGGGVKHAPDALVGTREIIRDPSLGTCGSGNHFVELLTTDSVMNRHVAYENNLVPGEVVIMIHSGSRDVGFFVGSRWMDRAKAEWPKGVRHPKSGLFGLTGPLAAEYMDAMGVASRYAWANRMTLGELVRDVFAEVFQSSNSRLIVDVPHNVVFREHGMNIHRKGATPARNNDLALIPGSMGDYSYIATGLGNPDWLWSCSHGAGRSIRRQAMRAVKPTLGGDNLEFHCVTLREERRIEEAPHAYKKIGPVIESQEEAGLLKTVAKLKPLVTFKA